MPYYDLVPTVLKQTFTRIRRTTGGAADSYGDATFTESRTTGFRGFVQWNSDPGEKVNIAGREISYAVAVYTSSTFLVGENDTLMLASSTSTSISTRYAILAIRRVYDGNMVDHTQVLCTTEIL